ncbi:nuclear body protein SP140-like protein isoform X2 [Pygocentrus nattereri]|uniref:nuclear body protein SP140-like protein isoform X2 n=1 Tax=Pygocentrus nattereri TaxID=42514 RepID=UPI0008148440|nr:nuclear body protein SP140-like protein isoform X2 [Pygocentrus nattereri]
MGVNVQMDLLDFLTKEELIRFFHCKKTEMSCMEEPNIFLHQLRDHNLVPEKLYKTVVKMRCKEKRKDGVYQILDWLEKERSDSVHLFWTCVFKDHILQKYPVLRLLRNSLMDGSFRVYENLPDPVDQTERESEPIQIEETTAKEKKKGTKRKKSAEETEEDEQPGPSCPSTPKQKKSAKKLVFSTPKKGDKGDIWTYALFKTHLPVTCGDKEGTLYRDKLTKGGKCILSNGRWFTPASFESFAGKGKWKNWKVSIRCQKTPLQKLIKDGHLHSPLKKRRCVKESPKVLFPVSSSESSSPLSESSVEVEHSGEDVLDEQIEEEEDESGEEEEDDEAEEGEIGPVDPSLFQTPSLPVNCGSVSGVLYKCRFASGSRSKSIRTEERWFTPEEFVKQELTLIDGHWKKDIQCHGKTLNYLLKKKILSIHSLLCKCSLCISKDQDQHQDNDDVCFICNTEGDLLCCDECPRAFHNHCHLPAVEDDSLGEKWVCTFCVLKTNQGWWQPTQMTKEEVLGSSISQYILHCEYLLLCMYKDDIEHVFTGDPTETISGYSRVIPNPMWLDRVKTKLQNKQYKTLGQFVSDVRLIFHNCHMFNKDPHRTTTEQSNDVFDKLGSRLEEVFEKEFQTIFDIH